MTSEIKNSLGSEIKSKYEAIAAKTEGYVLLSDAMSGSLMTSPAPGDYTNVSVVRNAFDKTYGATYALKIKEPHATGASSYFLSAAERFFPLLPAAYILWASFRMPF